MDYHVFNAGGIHVASTLHVEEAACLMSFLGEGATIRTVYETIIYTEGKDAKAWESYDEVVNIVFDNLEHFRQLGIK